MEDRLNLQEKIENLEKQIVGIGRERRINPGNIFCFFFGMDADNEICRSMERSMKKRYGSRYSLHCYCGNSISREALHEHLGKVWENWSGGMSKGADRYYMPIIFLIEEEANAELPEFIGQLCRDLRREGISKFEFDLYGLLDYGKTEVKKQWEKISDAIFKLLNSCEEAGDMYILSKDVPGSGSVYGRALSAIEANIYLKTCSYQSVLEGIWRRPGSLFETGDNSRWWKVLGYCKADIIEYLICKIYDDILLWQYQGSLKDYEKRLEEAETQVWADNEWILQLTENSERIPIRAADMEKAMADSGSIFQFWKRGKNYLSNGELLQLLYGSRSFLKNYGMELEEKKKKAADMLLDRFMELGTILDMEQGVKKFLEHQAERWESEEKYYEQQITLNENQPAAYGSKTYIQFLSRFHQDYVSICGKWVACSWKKEIVEAALARYNSKRFQSAFKKEAARLEESRAELQKLMRRNLIHNNPTIQLLFQRQEEVWERDIELCWKDDILQMEIDVLKQKSRRDIVGTLQSLIKEEGNNLLCQYLEEIRRSQNDGLDFPYVIYGNSNALRHNIREAVIFGSGDVIRLKQQMDLDIGKEIPGLDMMKWEYVAINDSDCMSGIYGLNSELEQG